MLLERAGEEARSNRSARRAPFELCGKQAAGLIHVEVVRCMADRRFHMPQVLLGCGYESLGLTFLIPGTLDQ
jgi:hypothetical protein